VALPMDITADSAGEAIVGKCVQEFGSLDVLVNNAGIYPQVPMLKMTPELFDRVYRVNLRALAFLSKAAGQQWVRQKTGGCVINIASVDSVHPSLVGLAAYDSSKGGVLMFTKNFALEMAPHRVRVNAILPGGVQTEGASKPLEGSGMTEAQLKEFMQRFIQTKVPMGRMGVPDDIAKVAVFLASPAAEYMTGSAVTVDGGMLLT
jgi:2-deoxy-D-gluconate 3-dehydrogenase